MVPLVLKALPPLLMMWMMTLLTMMFWSLLEVQSPVSLRTTKIRIWETFRTLGMHTYAPVSVLTFRILTRDVLCWFLLFPIESTMSSGWHYEVWMRGRSWESLGHGSQHRSKSIRAVGKDGRVREYWWAACWRYSASRAHTAYEWGWKWASLSLKVEMKAGAETNVKLPNEWKAFSVLDSGESGDRSPKRSAIEDCDRVEILLTAPSVKLNFPNRAVLTTLHHTQVACRMQRLMGKNVWGTTCRITFRPYSTKLSKSLRRISWISKAISCHWRGNWRLPFGVCVPELPSVFIKGVQMSSIRVKVWLLYERLAASLCGWGD